MADGGVSEREQALAIRPGDAIRPPVKGLCLRVLNGTAEGCLLQTNQRHLEARNSADWFFHRVNGIHAIEILGANTPGEQSLS